MVSVQTQHMSLEEFIQRYDAAPFELINGEIYPIMPTVFGHTDIIHRLFTALLLYLMSNPLGRVYMETTFALVEGANWVKGSRVPDILFYEQTRFETYQANNPDLRAKPLILVPDLVVEVLSENDNFAEVAQKVEMYLQDGVRLIWVIDPKPRRVIVYAPGQSTQFLGEADQVSGQTIIPGFTIAVQQLFES